ncbi:hypothetical protein PR048_007698 [Dryococelus australis]|uniref:DUF4371 domain-containing protein n=1 Tax=Dryococelus australis TaxID=614101 RepID=A0ABQ9HUZ6_9NEOP|nr:hypothetical protein PR048_007698 [Dryococelus australis]
METCGDNSATVNTTSAGVSESLQDTNQKPWTPSAINQFPYNEVVRMGKPTKKYSQRSHLEKFHWLIKTKGYTVNIAYFLQLVQDVLVKVPLRKFDNMLGEKGDLVVHEKNQYHIIVVDAGEKFLLTYHNPALEIANQIHSQRMAQVQNIPLRGHRDDKNIGNLLSGDEKHRVVNNDGNLRQLLRFRMDAGDNNLRRHLESAPSNATYISKHTQNDLINCCKEGIQSTILRTVKEEQFFSVIFDDTTDISSICQLSIYFRYLREHVQRENFITFVNAYDMIREEDIK